MPIYEYECVSQRHRFEELQKISEKPLSKCRICGGTVRQLISSTSFQLKGAGWYEDGYGRGNGSSKGTDAGKAACSGCEAKCETKTKE